MTLSERLAEYVAAGFSGIWIRSFEHDEAVAEIDRLCRERSWSLSTWDIDAGLSGSSASGGAGRDPLTAIHSLRTDAGGEATSLLVLRNFHRFLGSAEIVQAIDRRLAAGRRSGGFACRISGGRRACRKACCSSSASA